MVFRLELACCFERTNVDWRHVTLSVKSYRTDPSTLEKAKDSFANSKGNHVGADLMEHQLFNI